MLDGDGNVINVAPIPRLLLTRDEAAKSMGVSTRTVDSLVANRDENGFPVCRVASRTLIPINALKEWIKQRTINGSPNSDPNNRLLDGEV
jgi:excisionase family DNA binding protein